MGSRAIKILVIQSWTLDRADVERPIRAAGVDADFSRADFEAAILAALAHDSFDLVIFDETTPGLTRAIVERCLALTGSDATVLPLADRATLGERVCAALAPRRQ